jgi:hypothetical protein
MSRLQIESFITLVNNRVFKGKQLDNLTAIWKEVTHYETCKVEVQKGERMGQPCGKACVKGKDTCMCHQPRPVKEKVEQVVRPRCNKDVKKGKCIRFCVMDSDTCAYHQPKEAPTPCEFQLLSGKRKNTTCGKDCVKGMTVCKRHSVEKQREAIPDKVIEQREAIPDKVIEQREAIPDKVIEQREAIPDKAIEQREAIPDKVIEQKEAIPDKVVEESQGCDSIMKSGMRKNQPCGKKCVSGKSKCVLHV